MRLEIRKCYINLALSVCKYICAHTQFLALIEIQVEMSFSHVILEFTFSVSFPLRLDGLPPKLFLFI